MTTSSAAERTSYDEVPYDSYPFPQSHPNRLATIASLLGMSPAPLATCRVLEMGCASGGNLIPMAAAMPEAQFTGIDASKRQIEQGTKIVDDLELRNIELLHLDILNFQKQFSKSSVHDASDCRTQFDFIICHGVYSWVLDSVQDQILEICAEFLSPHGVAYISYNTNPGWRMRGMVRDLMSYRANFFETADAKTQEARALLDFLAAAVPTDNNPYGLLLNSELEMLRNKADHYLFHEHLEEHNEPLYFHEFVKRAAAKQLQYLGEAEFSMMAASNFPPNIEAMVRRLASNGTPNFETVAASGKPRVSREQRPSDELDVIQLEQYMDFVRNRMFRQTLLCLQDAPIHRESAPQRLLGMYVASSAAPAESIQDLNTRETVVFRRPGSSLTTSDPLVKASMTLLREAWPAPVLFEDLVTRAIENLCAGPLLVDSDKFHQDAMRVATPLLNCYATGHVDLYVEPFSFSLSIDEFPAASSLARRQVKRAASVTTLLHDTTRLNDLERRLLPLLDGTNDRAALVDALRADVAAGKLVLRDKGSPVTSEDRIAEILDDMISRQLAAIAQRGLLAAG